MLDIQTVTLLFGLAAFTGFAAGYSAAWMHVRGIVNSKPKNNTVNTTNGNG